MTMSERLKELTNKVQRRKQEMNVLQGQKQMLQDRVTELTDAISELKEDAEVYDKVTALLNSIGEDKQQDAQDRIEGIVTRGLQTIFGSTFSFHIVQTMKGKHASVEFFIRTHMGDNVIETPVLESHGGGLAAIVGFLLRVTVMLLDKSETSSNVMILDETFGMVSEEYLEPLAEFVRDLVDKTDIQIILITHQSAWTDYADKTYRFGIKEGATFVRESE